jgi:hypothetical protein
MDFWLPGNVRFAGVFRSATQGKAAIECGFISPTRGVRLRIAKAHQIRRERRALMGRYSSALKRPIHWSFKVTRWRGPAGGPSAGLARAF